MAQKQGQLISQKNQSQIQRYGNQPEADMIKLRWREGKKAQSKMDRYCDAVVNGSIVYFKEVPSKKDEDKIHAYDTTISEWSMIKDCPVFKGSALAVINGKLTTVGGYDKDRKNMNNLFSLIGAGEKGEKIWTEDFPPMPTKRYNASALCVGTALIIVGGEEDDDVVLKTVEILDTSTRQWHTAAKLPEPLHSSSMTVCGDRIYLLGGGDKNGLQSVYSCSVSTLLTSLGISITGALSRVFTNDTRTRVVDLLSTAASLPYLSWVSTFLISQWRRIARVLSLFRTDTWTRVANLPVTLSTAASLHGHLLAVGGYDSHYQPTSDIYRYNPSTNSWEVISHMDIPRFRCFAAVLPDNQLMAVGGWGRSGKEMNSVEFATVEFKQPLYLPV